ncbi:MAG: AAA family ATPase [Bacteroidaceae bacterium]|nr:AAA family ATPase [Bacteroidaceae bacterium]
MDFVLTQQQHQVLDSIKIFMESDASVFILRGYAGTGKTTMVKQIADYISQSRDVALMAPTGRAARVLGKKTGYESSTIHRAIYSSFGIVAKEVKDVADSEYKLIFPIRSVNGKVVAIVDEASMLCSRTMEHELFQFGTDNLMDDLLTYVRPDFGGKVIFVGDPAQLPPVGESESNALNADFFVAKDLKVMQADLREVIRQTRDSVILKNAMQIRNLLESDKRNSLVFDEKQGDVESLPPTELLSRYILERKESDRNDCVIICYSNKAASEYNKFIRQQLYGMENPELREGDVLLVVQNNYKLDRMNGEFVPVLSVGEKIKHSAPVYVQEGGQKVRRTITLEFQQITVADSLGKPRYCMILLDLLYSGAATLVLDEQRALYINFCMRNPHLKQGTIEFRDAILEDEYYNCLKAKFGYAVTGHKCQGGEWGKVFVDYSDRTGLSNDCLRWAYTATTRAQKTLYVCNLPHITPFSKFRIEPIQQCSKMNGECRILDIIEPSPYHDSSVPDYLHAKCRCIMQNMEWTPYRIESVISKPYQEIYHIQTPDGIERYDIRYKKGGIFVKAIPQTPSQHSVMIGMMLDNERAIPIVFDYLPSDTMFEKLYNLIRSACDGLSIQITNVVEHKEDYSVMYYFRTSDTFSYLKIYIDASGFVTYAKPMSLIGQEDKELKVLIEAIINHFE